MVWVGWSKAGSLASVGLEEREVLEREELELERGPPDQLSLVRRHARLGHRLRHDRLRQQLRVAGGRLRRVGGVLQQRLMRMAGVVRVQVGWVVGGIAASSRGR